MWFRQQDTKSEKHKRFLWSFLLFAVIYGPPAHSDAGSDAMRISPADLGAWQERSFQYHTQYRVEEGGQGPALHARAEASASVLCRKVRIDLTAQPIARWAWRLEVAPQRSDERGKSGDDQGLRLSFLHRAGETDGSIVAVQYVWSQNEPVGATWPNAFTDSAHQIVARSGPALPGTWQAERRDLQADFRLAFGPGIDRVDAICLMSDGDQTGALVEGWYGDITMQTK